MNSSELTDSEIHTVRLNAVGINTGKKIKNKIHSARRNAIGVNAGKNSQKYSVTFM